MQMIEVSFENMWDKTWKETQVKSSGVVATCRELLATSRFMMTMRSFLLLQYLHNCVAHPVPAAAVIRFTGAGGKSDLW
jgi:hypothetical protein